LEKEKEKLIQNLSQLRKELIEVKRLLGECKKGFEIIDETGNIRVASKFSEYLNGLEDL